MKGDLIKDKFLLNEICEPDYTSVGGFYSLSQREVFLKQKSLLTINDYFQDSKCGLFILELDNCFLVKISYLINFNKYCNLENYFYHINDDILDLIDEKNVVKYLFFNSKYTNINQYVNYPFNFFVFNSIISRDLFFPKSKYSKRECEYWAHICLRLYVTFLSTNLVDLEYRINVYLTDSSYKSSKIRDMKKCLSLIDGNAITFLLEACMDYDLKKNYISNEVKKLNEVQKHNQYLAKNCFNK